MKDPYTGTERTTLRLSTELKTMLTAVAVYEHRSESQVVRLALAKYFADEGYLDTTKLMEGNDA